MSEKRVNECGEGGKRRGEQVRKEEEGRASKERINEGKKGVRASEEGTNEQGESE